MFREILINVEAQEKRVAIIEDRKLEEFYVERQTTQKLVGNIYKGIVEAVVPAVGAAFVNIGLGKNGFLYVQDLRPPDYEKIAEIIERPNADKGTA
ncbi:MAG: ribonuclease G, partial [Candidatus Omnitrophica bacterium]|nr:ribonuclease G [Candidatus Omnitrophota bacterium]